MPLPTSFFNIGTLRWGQPIKSGGSYFEPISASGLLWAPIGEKKSDNGVELTSTELAEALMRVAFTELEWCAFGVNGLTTEHFIESDGSYFKPLGTSGLQWHSVGKARPRQGIKLTNAKLAKAIKTRSADCGRRG